MGEVPSQTNLQGILGDEKRDCVCVCVCMRERRRDNDDDLTSKLN